VDFISQSRFESFIMVAMVGITARTLPFAALTILGVSAATQSNTLNWPFGPRSELPSPDGQHVIYGEPYQRGVRQGPELWIRHRGRSDRKRLLELASTARAFWYPDSRNFIVIEQEGSSSGTSYIYDTEGRVVQDARAALLHSDSELGAVANGHFYVAVERLLNADTMRIAAFGHTDEPPVRCFRFVYTMTRGGKIERLSRRISPATATTCDERSE
jgi:hypothetical protein